MVGFGLLAVAMFWATSSPLADLGVGPGLRRLMTGFFFAGGATLIIYSPLGEISGGHVNPSVTLAFRSLGKISARDTLFYVFLQLAGAVVGVGALWLVLVQGLGWREAIVVGATQPTDQLPIPLVFAAEVLITFLLMLTILIVSNRTRIMRLTPSFAGLVVMLEVWLEAPISGTSLNEARSLAPAIFAGVWRHHWIYVFAPIIGAQIAALAYQAIPRLPQVLCCKLYHTARYPCHMADCKLNVPKVEAAAPDAAQGGPVSKE